MASSKNLSKGSGSMSVRIDDEVVEWISILKDAINAGNMSDAIRHGLLRAYPDLPQVAEIIRAKESERQAMLDCFVGEDDES